MVFIKPAKTAVEEEKKKKKEGSVFIKPTPPLQKEMESAGNAYIKEREKLASKLGISSRTAAEMMIPSQQAYQEQEAAEDIGTAKQKKIEELKKSGILGTIGQVPEAQGVNPEYTIGSTLKDIAPDIAANILQSTATGAGLGALGGAAIGGVGAVPGAVVGGAAGFIKAAFQIVGDLKEHQRYYGQIEYRDFTTSVKGLKAVIVYAKNGGDPVDARNLYNDLIANIYRQERNLKQLEEQDWLSKAKKPLTAIQNFRETQATYDLALENALLQNPNAIYDFPLEPAEILE